MACWALALDWIGVRLGAFLFAIFFTGGIGGII
jgi:hypothetical protein